MSADGLTTTTTQELRSDPKDADSITIETNTHIVKRDSAGRIVEEIETSADSEIDTETGKQLNRETDKKDDVYDPGGELSRTETSTFVDNQSGYSTDKTEVNAFDRDAVQILGQYTATYHYPGNRGDRCRVYDPKTVTTGKFIEDAHSA